MIPPIADRFVAGETQTAALEHATSLQRDGIGTIVNLLGEHYSNPDSAAEDRETYVTLLERIDDAGLPARISVKPTQLGLLVGEETFRANLETVVSTADSLDRFVWIDMEDHTTTDATLDAYVDLATEFEGSVGVCLQSNLRRTREDLERVAGLPGSIRLVKGAYDEPRDIAYTESETVDEMFHRDIRYMFEHFEDGIAIGTHDQTMIDYAIDREQEFGTPAEFQLLMGVREDEQRRLANRGYDVWQYVPYGSKWLSYFYRRLRERKENVLFAVRALLG
ncbi:MAG: proline dehydrogenase family protein [Halodesulfurarchaeum sp.]